MTVSHAAEEAILGGERRTDGLWVHRGKLSVGAAGGGSAPFTAPYAAGDLNVSRAPNIGVIYFGGRSDTYLYFDGTKFNLVGGPLSFTPAADTITTSAIQGNAVQQMIGSYVQAVGWSLPQSNLWTESPIQVTVSLGGNPTRIEFTFAISCPTKGQRVLWGLMVDGGVPGVILGGIDAPEANYGAMANGCYYVTPVAGSHRLSIGVYGPSGAALSNQVASTFYVTEQKR